MPKDKPRKQSGGSGKAPAAGKAAPATTDARFANFETDPRFRLPSRKKNKTTIDRRFARMLEDDEFTAASRVDRYGRRIKDDSKKKVLERLYREEEGEDGEEDDEKEDGKKDKKKSEKRKKHGEKKDEETKQDESEDDEGDDDEIIQRELRAADARYDPARGGGFSASESESDSDDDEDEYSGGAELDVATGPGMDRFREEQADVEIGEVTRRIAVVNLDWDHIKSEDLMALFSSFAPSGERVEKVSIYPSEFGKERMRREELEGPPREIFNKESGGHGSGDDDGDDDSSNDSDDSDEETRRELLEEGDDRDFDSDALRAYQLDRLRYYYAVVTCSSPAAALKIYEATDGSEYMASSNFLDLRFVPDDVILGGDGDDDRPRDECDHIPTGHRPMDFVTDALQHSRVKLTWDVHPEELSRKESIKKAFSGSRAEIAENDLRAYLASDSEDDDGEDGVAASAAGLAGAGEADDGVDGAFGDADAGDAADGISRPVPSKKELARRKMRAALGLGDEPAPRKKGSKAEAAAVGDMQITFAPALSGKESSKNTKAGEEETTIEKYKRKERERKAKKKEKALAKREGGAPDEGGEGEKEEGAAAATEEDLGFNDPFFTTEDPTGIQSKSAARKDERRKKREAREADEAANAAEKARLELLMAEDPGEQAPHLDHFDMNEIVRAEKRKGKKQRKKAKGKAEKGEAAEEGEESRRGGLQEGFELDVADARFKAVFDSHEFAIDPSNPKFKATSGMKKLLEEGRKRKAEATGNEDDDHGRREKKKKKETKRNKRSELGHLVEAVKKKSSKR